MKHKRLNLHTTSGTTDEKTAPKGQNGRTVQDGRIPHLKDLNIKTCLSISNGPTNMDYIPTGPFFLNKQKKHNKKFSK
jgi:hypothetical protein